MQRNFPDEISVLFCCVLVYQVKSRQENKHVAGKSQNVTTPPPPKKEKHQKFQRHYEALHLRHIAMLMLYEIHTHYEPVLISFNSLTPKLTKPSLSSTRSAEQNAHRAETVLVINRRNTDGVCLLERSPEESRSGKKGKLSLILRPPAVP